MPLRILQVIPAIAPIYGGPSIGALAVHTALLSQGVQAVMLTSSYASDDGRRLPTEAVAQLTRNRNLILLEPRRPFRVKHAASLLNRLWREVRAADLVHVHGQFLASSVIAPILARLLRVPYGIQPHGTLEKYQQARGSRFKLVYQRTVGKIVIGGASYVMVASPTEVRNSYEEIADKAVVVPLGGDLHEPEAMSDVAHRIGMRPRRLVFLFLGRLAEKKRPDLLIEAWAASRLGEEGILVVAGPDGDFSSEQLRDAARRLGVADSVAFAGEVDAHQKSWLFRTAGCFVLPSENENFGIAVAEALTAGCIVITTNQVAAAVHVERANAGFVLDQSDVKSLGEALDAVDDLLDVDVEAARTRASQYAAAHLSWQSVARELDRLGRRLVLHI